MIHGGNESDGCGPGSIRWGSYPTGPADPPPPSPSFLPSFLPLPAPFLPPGAWVWIAPLRPGRGAGAVGPHDVLHVQLWRILVSVRRCGQAPPDPFMGGGETIGGHEDDGGMGTPGSRPLMFQCRAGSGSPGTGEGVSGGRKLRGSRIPGGRGAGGDVAPVPSPDLGPPRGGGRWLPCCPYNPGGGFPNLGKDSPPPPPEEQCMPPPSSTPTGEEGGDGACDTGGGGGFDLPVWLGVSWGSDESDRAGNELRPPQASF